VAYMAAHGGCPRHTGGRDGDRQRVRQPDHVGGQFLLFFGRLQASAAGGCTGHRQQWFLDICDDDYHCVLIELLVYHDLCANGPGHHSSRAVPVSGKLDEHAFHDGRGHVEHRLGVSVRPSAGDRPVLPGLRRAGWWCPRGGGREPKWGLGAVRDATDLGWQPRACGTGLSCLPMDREGDRCRLAGERVCSCRFRHRLPGLQRLDLSVELGEEVVVPADDSVGRLGWDVTKLEDGGSRLIRPVSALGLLQRSRHGARDIELRSNCSNAVKECPLSELELFDGCSQGEHGVVRSHCVHRGSVQLYRWSGRLSRRSNTDVAHRGDRSRAYRSLGSFLGNSGRQSQRIVTVQ
jgi:hypothetical protein